MQEKEKRAKKIKGRGSVSVCGVFVILGEVLLQMTCTLAHTCALINNNHDMKKQDNTDACLCLFINLFSLNI